MNVKLASLCLKLWTLGLVGMGTVKGIFGLGHGTVGFDLCALVWIAGGATYALIGAMYAMEHASSEG